MTFLNNVHSPAHALDQFFKGGDNDSLFNRRFLVDYLFNFLFNHRAIGQRFASAHPSYPPETPCSQCTARIETHTADNACNNEQAHNEYEEQCIHEAVSFLSRVCCTYRMIDPVLSRRTPTPCLPAQGMCSHHSLSMLWRRDDPQLSETRSSPWHEITYQYRRGLRTY